MQMRSYVQHTSEQPDRKGRRGFTDACKTVCCPYNKSATYEPESKHTVERDWGTAETQGLYMYRGAECSSKYLSARWIPPSLSIGNCQQQTTPCSVLLGQPKGCSLTTVPSLLFCSQSHTGAPLEVCESRKKRTRSGT